MQFSKKLHPESIKKIVQSHVRQYTNRVAAAEQARKDKRPTIYNLEECTHYLHIWEEISKSLELGKDLSDAQEGEIFDAVLDGDYDRFLNDEDIKVVQEFLEVGEEDVRPEST